ncbi:MAG: hypothetical protein E7187_07390 [Erysipelotrichaceae bacterium]|nr:hypothetical protein [Erysipelotrichaceae bacterium]MBR2701774.1 hypothetical protein [Erysipelotrichaceae bacterium]MBR2745527.1 hypothetical protein [Erysipelotrichaceae bacterium]
MTKVHKYLIQSIALLIFGRYVLLNRETVNPYFALVVLCCRETVITLLYVFVNRKTISKDESQWEFISIYAYIVVIVIVSMFFLM